MLFVQHANAKQSVVLLRMKCMAWYSYLWLTMHVECSYCEKKNECEASEASISIIVGFPDLHAGSQGLWTIQLAACCAARNGYPLIKFIEINMCTYLFLAIFDHSLSTTFLNLLHVPDTRNRSATDSTR